jgi:hypothetical protein
VKGLFENVVEIRLAYRIPDEGAKDLTVRRVPSQVSNLFDLFCDPA